MSEFKLEKIYRQLHPMSCVRVSFRDGCTIEQDSEVNAALKEIGANVVLIISSSDGTTIIDVMPVIK